MSETTIAPLDALRDFWTQQVRDEHGRWAHPSDREALDRSDAFDLERPAVPYLGEPGRVPVVFLGADPRAMTAAAVALYRPLLESGRAAVVLACAYFRRSDRREPIAPWVARLDSSRRARTWALNALLPRAAAGERLLVIQRPNLWRLPPIVTGLPGVLLGEGGDAPAPNTLAAVDGWLAGYRTGTVGSG